MLRTRAQPINSCHSGPLTHSSGRSLYLHVRAFTYIAHNGRAAFVLVLIKQNFALFLKKLQNVDNALVNNSCFFALLLALDVARYEATKHKHYLLFNYLEKRNTCGKI
jgi:hypothetical protein